MAATNRVTHERLPTVYTCTDGLLRLHLRVAEPRQDFLPRSDDGRNSRTLPQQALSSTVGSDQPLAAEKILASFPRLASGFPSQEQRK
ncbi:hypothetical protein Q31b_39040 [Novipirellula aureliae]|uniref:Uncharacterized protein n=1 Tax=Novipirellula aureliae TaxID=2527966 RepID=A0A5C6DUT4_9BACT|nr:hypothetical protein Q31b_39040 [Novipirellula aureliae]